MHTMKRKGFVFFIAAFFLMLIHGGCDRPPPAPENQSSGIHAERMLVLPFKDMASVYGDGAHARCPITGKMFLTGPVRDGAVALLTDALAAAVMKTEALQVTAPGKGVGAISEIVASSPGALPDRALWARAARNLGADVVLAGYIYRFKDRVGTGYAVESPASVAFDLHLVDARSGRLIWTDGMDETQQSLSENLLNAGTFFKRGARWITADELATAGLDQILSTLPLD
jgi:hypothetical protein